MTAQHPAGPGEDLAASRGEVAPEAGVQGLATPAPARGSSCGAESVVVVGGRLAPSPASSERAEHSADCRDEHRHPSPERGSRRGEHLHVGHGPPSEIGETQRIEYQWPHARACRITRGGRTYDGRVLLAIDTSAGTSVAVVDPTTGRTVAERSTDDSRRHAEVVGPFLAEVLAEAGITGADVTGVVAGTGPGPSPGCASASPPRGPSPPPSASPSCPSSATTRSRPTRPRTARSSS